MSRLAALLFLCCAALLPAPVNAAAAPPSPEAFPLCANGPRTTCVVDGDTFWLRGEKIRIADINTPETSQPACAREAALGKAATRALQALLAQGPFTLAPAPDGRDRDRYGRLLRTVTRNGQSLGAQLVKAGLAEPWQGRRGNWCGNTAAAL